MVGLNGIGIFLGDNDITTDTFVRHVDYVVELLGPEHVGLGIDYPVDQKEVEEQERTTRKQLADVRVVVGEGDAVERGDHPQIIGMRAEG